jgi:hypothetical protein
MDAIEERIVELTREVCRLYCDFANVDEAIESMQNQNVSAQFVKGIYEQLSEEANNLTKTCRKNAEKHKFYTIEEKEDRCGLVVAWTSRYFLMLTGEDLSLNSHKITVFDSFNDKFMYVILYDILNRFLREVTVEKSAKRLISIHPLDDDFGLLKERQHKGDTCSISLVFLDLYGKKLEKLTTITYPSRYIFIIVNKIEPTEFLVCSDLDNTVQICRVEKISIILGDMIDIDFRPQSLYDGQIYGSGWIYDEEVMNLLFRLLFNSFNLSASASLHLQYGTEDNRSI